jgi:hypothetical protein
MRLRHRLSATLADSLTRLIHPTVQRRANGKHTQKRWRVVIALLAAAVASGSVVIHPSWAFPLGVGLAAAALAWELAGQHPTHSGNGHGEPAQQSELPNDLSDPPAAQ